MGDLVLRSSETVLLQLVVNDDDVIINGLNGNRHKSNFSLCRNVWADLLRTTCHPVRPTTMTASTTSSKTQWTQRGIDEMGNQQIYCPVVNQISNRTIIRLVQCPLPGSDSVEFGIQEPQQILGQTIYRHANFITATSTTIVVVVCDNDKCRMIRTDNSVIPLADHSLTPEPQSNMARPNHLDLLSSQPPLNNSHNMKLRKMSSVS